MNKYRVLIVDDEEDLRELLRYNLNKEGFEAVAVESGEDCLEAVKDDEFDIILLDLMMPKIGGLETCRILKSNEKTKSIPIIMVTAKGEESDIVIGLELGADDYITKPFSNRVLIARINSVLRRIGESQDSKTSESEETFQRGPILIDTKKHEVKINGEKVKLTFSEFFILYLLAKNPGWVKSRTQIIKHVHGEDYPVTDRAIDVQIVGLRKKLGEAGKLIETIRGIGYRFSE